MNGSTTNQNKNVGESDHDFSWCSDFNRRRWRGDGSCLSLGRFSFFFFFFCNHVLFVFRYKKPHAALAMEKTKPINQKQVTKESHGTNLNIHYRAGFSSAGPSASYNKESTN